MFSLMISPLRAWAQLVRLPNLFTVPGDALAGGLLVAAATGEPARLGALALAGASALLLYIGGLLLNDLLDRAEDLEERPDRPLPSGAVEPSSVAIAATWSFAVGVVLASLAGGLLGGLAAAAIALLATAYDAWGKRVPHVGPALMAACRGGSVLLGAVVAGGAPALLVTPVWAAFAAHGLYVLLLTRVAATETSGRRPDLLDALAPAAAAATATTVALLAAPMSPPFVVWVILGLALGEGLHAGWRAATGRLPVPAYIGRLIRGLLTWQALWIVWGASARGATAAALALAAAVASKLFATWAARRYYGS